MIANLFQCLSWEAAGVILTAIFSILLLYFTIRIALRQNELQKQIADRDMCLQNYQHRVKCYMQIVEAFDILMNMNVMNVVNLIECKNTQSEMLKDLSRGRNLMLKTYIESKLLFSQKLIEMIKKIHDDYLSCYNLGFSVVVQSQSQPEKIINFAKSKGIDNMDKLMAAMGNPDSLKDLQLLFPELIHLIELDKNLKQQFQSEEFNEMILKESRVG